MDLNLLGWFLVFANLIGGFVAASSYIAGKITKLEKTSEWFSKLRLPVGIAVLVISVLNIFNFSSPHYLKLTLLFGLITGFILSVDLLKNFNINEQKRTSITDLANRYIIVCGLISFIIGLVWVLRLITDILKILL